MTHVFITGGTGYLGGYVCTRLLERHPDLRLSMLVRGSSVSGAREKLWRSWQLHWGPSEFIEALSRVDIYLGDLHQPNLGLSDASWAKLSEQTDSVLHVAASLNRKSERACLNSNLRGSLSVLRLARSIADTSGLDRFSFVSTAAVAGERWREVVPEDQAIRWDKRQYDPYARTKAFGEHMVHELLPDVSTVIFRPATVLGDSRFSATTQWDMVRAYAFFADLPVLPWGPDIRQDIVNADYVGDAVAHIHMLDKPKWGCYHLSAGNSSCTSAEIVGEIARAAGSRGPRFSSRLQGPFDNTIRMTELLAPGAKTARMAALLRVFLPYVTNDTVFDNGRVIAELGRAPVPFVRYAANLLEYAKEHKFQYPYTAYPDGSR